MFSDWQSLVITFACVMMGFFSALLYFTARRIEGMLKEWIDLETVEMDDEML
jgi:hypothetical protein